MKTIHSFREWLEEQANTLELFAKWGPPDVTPGGDTTDHFYMELECGEIVTDAQLWAAKLGCDLVGRRVESIDPQAALAIIGKLLCWAEKADRSPTMDVREVAKLLSCDQRTVWRHEGKGLIPEARRIGGLVRWDRLEMEEWLANANTSN